MRDRSGFEVLDYQTKKSSVLVVATKNPRRSQNVLIKGQRDRWIWEQDQTIISLIESDSCATDIFHIILSASMYLD